MYIYEYCIYYYVVTILFGSAIWCVHYVGTLRLMRKLGFCR